MRYSHRFFFFFFLLLGWFSIAKPITSKANCNMLPIPNSRCQKKTPNPNQKTPQRLSSATPRDGGSEWHATAWVATVLGRPLSNATTISWAGQPARHCRPQMEVRSLLLQLQSGWDLCRKRIRAFSLQRLQLKITFSFPRASGESQVMTAHVEREELISTVQDGREPETWLTCVPVLNELFRWAV